MAAFIGPLLAVALLSQGQTGRPADGEVVDAQGHPVSDAQVILHSPATTFGKGDAVDVQTTSDSAGKFRLTVPPLKRLGINGVDFLAYRPGYAITARELMRPPHRLVLEKPVARAVMIDGPDGKPVAGAKVALRLVHIFNGSNAEMPTSLAESLATSTGSDGKATITCMAPRDQLVAVRVTADAIGTQDILLIERPGLRLRGRGDCDPAQADAPPGGPGRRPRRARRRQSVDRGLDSRRRMVRGKHGRPDIRPVAHGGRRLVSDSRQPHDRVDLSGRHRRDGQGPHPVRLDHDWREKPELAPDGAAAPANDQRAGGRPARKGRRRNRGVSIGRRPRGNRNPCRRRRTFFPGRISPGVGVLVCAATAFASRASLSRPRNAT